MKKTSKSSSKEMSNFKRAVAILLIVAGLLGLFASFALTIDKIALLKDPGFQPICNLNPVFSCSDVMKSSQSEIMGIPNSLLGIVGYTAVVVTGVAILAGATFRRWYWIAFNIGLIGAIALAHWLFVTSVFDLGTICLFCMTTWFTTIPLFWYVTVYNLREGHIALPKQLKAVNTFIQLHHGDIVAVWYLIFAAIILNHFWYYWQTFLP